MRGKLVERITSDGRSYELRRDKGMLCLYAEGVLHTAFDEIAVISGRVWDLLSFAPIAERSARVLVLGVGGGAAIRQMLTLGAVRSVDGVDLDPVHLDLAKRFFGLDDPRVALTHEDARTFIARASVDEPYDCIVDDVFAENGGHPHRAIAFDRDWAELLLARLAPSGILVVNHAGRAEVREGVIADPAFQRRFEAVLTLETSTAGNVVVVLSRRPMSPTELRARGRAALGEAAARLDLTIRSR